MTPELRRWRWLVWSERGPAGATKRAILQVLHDFYMSSPDGAIFPSVETIAAKAGITKRHAMRHLGELEAGGWLRREVRGASGQGWKRHCYTLRFPHHFDASKDEWLAETERKRRAGLESHLEQAASEPPF